MPLVGGKAEYLCPLLSPVDEEVFLMSEYSKQLYFLKMLNTELLCDLAVPLLGIYPEKIIT